MPIGLGNTDILKHKPHKSMSHLCIFFLYLLFFRYVSVIFFSDSDSTVKSNISFQKNENFSVFYSSGDRLNICNIDFSDIL